MDTVVVPAILGLSGGLVAVYMTGLFGLAVTLKDNSVADVGWGFGFVLVAAMSFVVGGMSPVQMLITALVTIWGLRLTTHIFLRHQGKPEDFRYAQWRKDWGEWFYLRSYIQVFLLQGVLMIMVASSVILTNAMRVEVIYPALVAVGIIVWAVGFAFEVIGDYQLSQFLKDSKNKGKIMRSGLWNYTRHPNYFGEVTGWWGIMIICLSFGLNPWLLIGPATISILILFVSGVPLLEKHYDGNKDYEEYRQRTSIFVPWFPRRVK